MQRIIAAIVALAALGIVTAFAAGQLVPSHQAGAAPTAQQVREQNLDGSGFIRVHEQGTSNVNVVSMPATPPPSGRVILIAENVNLAPSENFTTNLVDTADCRSLALFLNLESGSVQPRLRLSADGALLVGSFIGTNQSVIGAPGGVLYFSVPQAVSGDAAGPVVAPKAAVGLQENTGNTPATVSKAWLYCSR